MQASGFTHKQCSEQGFQPGGRSFFCDKVRKRFIYIFPTHFVKHTLTCYFRSYIHDIRNEFNLRAAKKTAAKTTNKTGDQKQANGSVTIVKVNGGGVGGVVAKGEEVSKKHIYQQQPAPKVASSSGSSRNRLDKAAPAASASSSSSTAQLAHRLSMTKLSTVPQMPQQQQQQQHINTATTTTATTFDSAGIYKSMTRLNASQQNMSRYNSASHVRILSKKNELHSTIIIHN